MSYIVNTPSIKKKFCIHNYQQKWEQHSGECYLYCPKCTDKKKPKSRQEKLIKFLCPASKPSKPDYFEEHQFMTNWYDIQHDGWKLPATADAHDWCGLWQTRGCLNEKEHHKLGYGNKIFVKQYQKSCFRAVCKICFKKWMGRQSNRSTRRIEKFEKQSGKRVKHIVLSIPKWLYHLPYDELKKKVNVIQKELGCEGGARIFHPFRYKKSYMEFYYSPHFHIVGIAKLSARNISEVARKFGWFVKDVGVRESVFQTFFYLLSHCGVKRSHHVLVWFGDASYSKLPSEKEPDSTICPLCNDKLVPIYHEGEHSGIPPDEVFEGFVDSVDWYEVKTVPKSEWTKVDRYEYALERELYVANSGISFSN